MLVNDPNLSVETNSSLSRLSINHVQLADEGDYLCQLSTVPPRHLKHSLTIKSMLTSYEIA